MANDNKKITPMMQQYLDVKAQHPDKIVFFRMGDFFEMFGEDAEKASEVLQIQLTARSKEKNAWPMCGVPAHAYEHYLNKLIQKGFKVVICDQTEDSSQAKGLVKREVVQAISPGISIYESSFNPSEPKYVAALYEQGDELGLVFLEYSLGEILFGSVQDKFGSFQDKLANFRPKEVVLLAADRQEGKLAKSLRGFLQNAREKALLDFAYLPDYPAELCLEAYQRQNLPEGLKESIKVLIGFSLLYIQKAYQADISHLKTLRPLEQKETMVLDAGTLRNLEVFQSSFGDESLGLFALFNHCKTPMGGRLLRSWFLQPFRNQALIERRLDFIDASLELRHLWPEIDGFLAKIGDLERLAQRVHLPKLEVQHLVRLKAAIKILPSIQASFSSFTNAYARELLQAWPALESLISLLDNTLNDDAGLKLKEGGFIKTGVNPELDRFRAINKDSKTLLLKVEAEEKARSSIQSLKLGYNRVFGFYFEISQANKKEVPSHFIRTQTLTNAERYTTEALKALEVKILEAENDVLRLEEEEFYKLCGQLIQYQEAIKKVSAILAEFDAVLNLAKIAERRNYSRPSFVLERKTEIIQGRHPVIESIKKDYPFVANDLFLKEQEQSTILITGPNMGGKSTYIRQNALILYLAQIGSFVPALKVETCLFDRIFTRVGAMDNLAEGQSTFMVEMKEASHIAQAATNQSLVVIDELGRGTSTFDGIGIAWGLVEHLDKLGAFTLFATHYHELTRLSNDYSSIQNFRVAIADDDESFVFLYKILPGAMKKSYGIEVARLAGMPAVILERASFIQKKFVRGEDFLIDEKKAQPLALAKKAAGGLNSVAMLQNLSLVQNLNKSLVRKQSNKLAEGLGQDSLWQTDQEKDGELVWLKNYLQSLALDQKTPLECMQILDQLKKRFVQEKPSSA